jgi:serine/threonine protein kinase
MKICPVCSTEYPDDVRFCPHDGQTLRSSSPGRDLVGQVVADRYHVVKKLGEGGMGQVYLAEHVKMGRRSAIKVLNPSMVHDPDAVARFNREAANASRISHPNICAIYDFGETPDGLIYLAMEFIEGEPLTDVVEREGSLPLDRAVGIFLQVAGALQAAHDLGIVHRDLKPDNIMLSRARDGTDVVKVVVFGIAKAVGRDDTQKVTKTGLVVGTPEFMSPEQLSGDTLDGRSDVYSLALVLFKMLTGELPFAGSTVQDTMVQRLTDEPATLTQVRPDLYFPPGVQETLDTALARSPIERYQSAAKFASDLSAVLGIDRRTGGASVPATLADEETELFDVVRTPRRTSGPRKRRSLVPIAVGAVLALGAAGAAVTIARNVRPSGGVQAIPPMLDTARIAAPPPQPEPVAPSRRDSIAASPRRESAATRPPRVARKPRDDARPRIDVTRAQDMLDTLYLSRLNPMTAPMVRDSAIHIFYAPGVSVRDKAYAAFVYGMALVQMNDRARGCEWVRKARDLNPVDTTYPKIVARC